MFYHHNGLSNNANGVLSDNEANYYSNGEEFPPSVNYGNAGRI